MNIRNREIAFVSKSAQYSSIIYLFDFFLKAVIIISTAVSFDIDHSRINAASIFISIAYTQLIFHSMLKTWPTSITRSREATSLFEKIRQYFVEYSPGNNSNNDLILSDEPKKNHRTIQRRKVNEHLGILPRVFLRNFVTSGRDINDDYPYELKCDFLEVSRGKSYCFVGGSHVERTRFARILIGEMDFDGGEVEIDGRISFASRHPCVVSGSIKQNVLFVEKYDEDKYKNIIEICDLQKDEEALNGCEIDEFLTEDLTLKHKINLARCFYADAEIYIVEDIFDGNDNEKWRNILSEFMKKLSKVMKSFQDLKFKFQISAQHLFPFLS